MKKILLITVLILILNIITVFAQATGIIRNDFSPNGKILATATYSGEISLWDLQTAKELNSFNSRINEPGLLKFLPDGKSLIVTDEVNDNIIFFDTVSGKEIKRLHFRGIYEVTDIFFSKDSQTMWMISSLSYDKPLNAWSVDLKTNKLKAENRLQGNNWIGNSNKDLLAFFSKEEKKIHLISAQNGKELHNIPVEKEYVFGDERSTNSKVIKMQFNADGSRLILYRKFSVKKGEFDYELLHELVSYSTLDGKLLKKESFAVNKENEYVFEGEPIITLNPAGTKIYLTEISSRSNDDTKLITAIDAGTLQKLNETFYPNRKDDWFDLSPDGELFLTADKTGKIKVWSNQTQKQVGSLFTNSTEFHRVAVSQDDAKYAAATANGLIKIWSSDGKELQKINTELPKVEFLVFSPNGQNLLSVHSTSYVKGNDEAFLTSFKIWNIATGKLIREFDNKFYLDQSPRSILFFTKQGDRLIADCTSDDKNKTIDFCIWNINTGEFVGRSFPMTKTISAYFWLPDNQNLIFGQMNQKLIDMEAEDERNFMIWNMADEKLIKQSIDDDEIAEAFPKNQSGTLIYVDTYEGINGKNKLFRVNADDEFKVINSQMDDYFVSQNQIFGAKFIPKPKKTENSNSVNVSLETTLPVPRTITPNKLDIALSEREEINDSIEIRNFENYDDSKTLVGHTDDLIDFVFTSKGEKGISTSFDRTIRVWDISTGKELFRLK